MTQPQQTAGAPSSTFDPIHRLEYDMEDSTSLLEKAGLNTLLPPYESPEKIQNLITTLQTGTSALPAVLSRFFRWVDLSEREIHAGHPRKGDLREIFQEFSRAISDYIEALSKLSQITYRRILTLQHDSVTDRELLAWIHEDLEGANLELVDLAELWLVLQHASRCMLFGNPTDEEALADPEQPPPSPASEESFEIMVEQAFALQSTMAHGVTRKILQPHDPAPAMTASPMPTMLLTPIVLLLLLLHFFGIP
ncbi:MAG: hypothetical protein LQ338_005859 [Usnochroma carphineum]|nr:MAG: hypothetical protein LQ338_005859 [Usnochroma carphineum]